MRLQKSTFKNCLSAAVSVDSDTCKDFYQQKLLQRIDCRSRTSITVEECAFQNLYGSGHDNLFGSGGAISFRHTIPLATLTVTMCGFRNCVVSFEGGAIVFIGKNIDVSMCEFIQCAAAVGSDICAECVSSSASRFENINSLKTAPQRASVLIKGFGADFRYMNVTRAATKYANGIAFVVTKHSHAKSLFHQVSQCSCNTIFVSEEAKANLFISDALIDNCTVSYTLFLFEEKFTTYNLTVTRMWIQNSSFKFFIPGHRENNSLFYEIYVDGNHSYNVPTDITLPPSQGITLPPRDEVDFRKAWAAGGELATPSNFFTASHTFTGTPSPTQEFTASKHFTPSNSFTPSAPIFPFVINGDNETYYSYRRREHLVLATLILTNAYEDSVIMC